MLSLVHPRAARRDRQRQGRQGRAARLRRALRRQRPYLVVAADKGTARFSDVANAISEEYGFWLGDAFASGGSAGYDHKEMGITARGGWESVRRHFRDLGHDTQSQDFTVAGIGDMSGDVFGNAMLLSPHIRPGRGVRPPAHLHRPVPGRRRSSFGERKRMFALPRSSWEDYDKRLLSKGGGVHSRLGKSVTLSAEARALLRHRRRLGLAGRGGAGDPEAARGPSLERRHRNLRQVGRGDQRRDRRPGE